MKSAFLHINFLVVAGVLVVLFSLGFAYPIMLAIAKLGFIAFISALIIDALLLYVSNPQLSVSRKVPARLSNGDENPVLYTVKGKLAFRSKLELFDEFPEQFQIRDFSVKTGYLPREFKEEREHILLPKIRGEYEYGKVHILLQSQLGLVRRKFSYDLETSVKVYPSFLQYKRYAFLAMNDRLQEAGVKRIRQLGGATEFEQIREYVRGDDYRRINWKATARRRSLLVNHYDEEKAQNIYFVIDKGRMMHMPFDGMALFDYAINSALVLSGIALAKGDKAGLITISNLIGTFLPSNQGREHIGRITEALYAQETRDKETDFLRLYKNIRARLKRRSLLMLFTNFESTISLQRQLPYLKALAKRHALVVVIFENTEVTEVASKPARGLKEVYDQSMAEHYILEKEVILNLLSQSGIYTVFTPPKELTINTINKYLELKSKGVI